MIALVTAVVSLHMPSLHMPPQALRHAVGTPRMMAQVDEFSLNLEFLQSKNLMSRIRVDDFTESKDVKNVRVFEGDYQQEIIDEVTAVGTECIAKKDSFSIAIPGGSVVTAFAAMDPAALDYSKVHVFLCNEKIPSYPCIAGALDAARKLGIPTENVHGFGEGSNLTEVAESYSTLMSEHPAINNTVMSVPSVDMMLLGTGPDGHVGCLFPESDEIKDCSKGKVVQVGNDERADGDFLAVSMDVMCASRVVLVSAAVR